MTSIKITECIKKKALELLEQHSEGLRYSELGSKILATDSNFKSNTVNGCIWNLDITFKDEVYKPSRGIFRLLKNKPLDLEILETLPSDAITVNKIKEEDVYIPFADWLKMK